MKSQSIHKLKVIIMNLFLILFITSCGLIETPSFKKGSYSDENIDGQTFRTVSVPSAYYESHLKNEFETANKYGLTQETEQNKEQIFYINFDGAEIQKGFNKMQSFLLCEPKAYIPKSNLKISQNKINEIISELEQNLNSSDFAQNLKIKLVNKMPIAGNFSTIFLGGAYPDLGCESDNPLIAIVPFDYGNLSNKDVGFIFTEAFKMNQQKLKNLLQKVILNLLGLKTLNEKIPSLYLPNNFNLSGKKEIHSFARLLWRLDSSSIMDISSIKEEIQKILPSGMEVPPSLNNIFTVTLGAAISKSSNPPIGNKIIDALSKTFNSEILDPNTVAALAIIAGHPEIAAAAEILIPIAQNQIDKVKDGLKNSEASKKLTLPNYTSLLGLDNISTMPELISYFRGHFQYVQDNYSGNTAEALKALLIYTYSYKFRNLDPAI